MIAPVAASIALLLLNSGGSDSVLQAAMRDELNRTMEELSMEDMASPYYVAYRIEDEWWTLAAGWFGAVVSSDATHARGLCVDLRVGTPELDNSNFAASDYLGSEPGSDCTLLPVDDDYDALRYAIWLETDAAYKDALEMLSRKRAVLKDRMVHEELPDFARVPTTVWDEDLVGQRIDRGWAEALVRDLSGVFREFEGIQYSAVALTSCLRHRWFVDSEGSSHTLSPTQARLGVGAYTQAPDGEEVSDWMWVAAPRFEDLPPAQTLRARVEDFARDICRTQAAPRAEDYFGPVLLKGTASPQVFYEIIGRGVSDPRRPVFDDATLEEDYSPVAGFLAGKLGRKLLPESFCVYDDPTMQRWEDVPLLGTFPVDEQGVAAQRVPLVESGKLVGLLMNRAPTKEVRHSNGHARSLDGGPVGLVGNLIVTCNKTEDDLEAVYRELLEDRGLEYGIVIERLAGDLPPEQTWSMWQAVREEDLAGQGDLLSEPLYAYRLHTDGHTEVVRGLAFEDVTYRVLRNIVAAGSAPIVHNIFLVGEFGRHQPATVVAPEVIVDEVALKATHPQPLKLPVVPHPYFD